MPTEETISLPDATTRPELRFSMTSRALFLFTGTILPIICFAIGYPDQPTWQSGEWSAFPRLVLSHKGSLPFYPFLIYNMTSMALIVFKSERFAANVWVRCGVYSGVVVALFFWGVFMLAFYPGTAKELPWQILENIAYSLLGIFIPWIAILFLKYATPKYLNLILILLVPLIGICIGFPFIIVYILIVVFFCSTPWAVASYTKMALNLLRWQRENRFRFTLAQLMGITTWFAGFFSAWRVSYLTVLEEYSKLPTTAPDCYICTTAARGHKQWVHSEECIANNGDAFRVNNQMRYFKAFELLLLTINPNCHRLCRKVYDTIGPQLAGLLKNPILADIVFSTLKPAEWTCRGVLYIITNDTDSCLGLLYRMDKK
jgi:hypothetical protein